MIAYAAPGDTWGISGPAFLRGYLAVCAVVLIGAVLHRRRVLAGADPATATNLTPQQVAYLNGGARLAVSAALAALRSAGAIGTGANRTLSRTGPLPAGATRLDQALHHLADRRVRPRDAYSHTWVRAALRGLHTDLERAGFLPTVEQRRAARGGPLLLLGLAAFGVVRLVAGLQNAKPVGYLLASLAVLVTLALVLLFRPVRRTRAGDQALKRLRTTHHYLAPKLRPAWSTYGPAGAGMGVALYGTAALWAADPAFAAQLEVHRAAASTHAASSSYGGCGAGGGGGGGDGGGGGGGCGGGGGGG